MQTFGNHTGPAAIVIGPEGGFDPVEREALENHPDARPISLGPRILRAETAVIAVTRAVDGDERRLG